MKNLLKADYSRLFKHKFIYVSIGFIILSVIFSWVLQFMNCKLLITERNAAAESGIEDHFDESIFLNLKLDSNMRYNFPILILICIFLTCIFIASDFSSNVIRNKIIIGYTHTQILCSYFTVMISAQFLLFLIYTVLYLIPIPILMSKYKAASITPKYFQTTFSDNVLFNIEGLLAVFALSALFLMFVLLFRAGSKASIAIVIMLAFFILFTGRVDSALYSYQPLEQDYVDIEIDPAKEENKVVVNDNDPHNGYGSLTAYMESIRGNTLSKRQFAIYSFCENISPVHQLAYVIQLDIPSPRIFLLCLIDILLIALFCTVGILSLRFNELN